MEVLPDLQGGTPARVTDQDFAARSARAGRLRRDRNRAFGMLLAMVSLTMFAIVVGLVIVFHALEAYRVIPGF